MLNNKMVSRPKCGEIWMANLNLNNGSVQGGYRPVFILSNDKNNTFSPNVNIIPLTSKKKRKLPMHVELTNYEEYGLKEPSTMLVEQVMTVSAGKLERYIGEITDTETLSDIREAMIVQFPIMHLPGLH